MGCAFFNIRRARQVPLEDYQRRITRFYKYWNPAKLVNPMHVPELLQVRKWCKWVACV